MRKGDKIRFLDAVGGGTIVQYDAQRELVWVETDDGFDRSEEHTSELQSR